MTTTTLRLDDAANGSRQGTRNRLIQGTFRAHEWDQARVAALSACEIAHLSDRELAGAIRGSRLPILRSEVEGRLEFYGRETLQRLAWLARRCCRNQGY